MRLRMITLLPVLLVTGLAGCGEDKKTEQSRYHYHLEKLNKRWVVVRKNFDSDKPEIFLAIVLRKDFADLVSAMKRTYKGSNRDEVLPKLDELAKKYWADIDTVIGRTNTGGAVLKPGKTVKDVGKVLEKSYAEYVEFEKLVK